MQNIQCGKLFFSDPYSHRLPNLLRCLRPLSLRDQADFVRLQITLMLCF